MQLHLKKLSVGSESVEGLEAWHREVLESRGRIMHVTRSFPRRAGEILPGGSIYWVIKGRMAARQAIAEFAEVEREDGGTSCGIVLVPGLVRVLSKRHRPFQGWRYLEGADAPPDLPGQGVDGAQGDGEVMPEKMAEELRDLGLL